MGGCAPLGGAGSTSNTMSPGPTSTSLPSGILIHLSMPSFILIHPTVWPQYTNVTDRTDRQNRQRSDSGGRTVLKTVAQKPIERNSSRIRPVPKSYVKYLLFCFLQQPKTENWLQFQLCRKLFLMTPFEGWCHIFACWLELLFCAYGPTIHKIILITASQLLQLKNLSVP